MAVRRRAAGFIGAGVLLAARNAARADVVRTEETTTIEEVAPIAGCEPFRHVIRSDGSGGRKQYKRGDGWANDKFDHDLEPIR